MSEKKKVTIVNLITGSRIFGTLLLPIVTSFFGPLGTAIYIGTLWATDALDGYLAKTKWKVSTIFGANLDAFSDKVLGCAILLYLRNFYPTMILPLIAELAIFRVNWHYGKKGSDVKSSKIGKGKTILLGIITALSILSTISLTSGLSIAIPTLITIIIGAEVVTLVDYIKSNKEYLKTHTPKNDVSSMSFFETIKTIIKKLDDKNLYSPEYYKEHKNETLLDMLLNKEIVNKENMETKKELKNRFLTVSEENELKIEYNLTNNEVKILEEYMKRHNIKLEEIKAYLDEYIKSVKNNYRTPDKMVDFINKQDKIKTKKK